MKRYTKSFNVRFEPYVESKLNEILEKDSQCQRQNWSKSDLIRHMTRVGIRNWEQNMRGRI
tara:strand:- start:134 stop:316 length:183 start_codon:yes stop_codon:yes gene_type:complete